MANAVRRLLWPHGLYSGLAGVCALVALKCEDDTTPVRQ